MRTLQIDESKARQLYKTAPSEFKATLECTFGKDFFTGLIMDRIKTYEDACEEIGINPLDEIKLMELGLTKHDIAYQKLSTIIKALNEGWIADVCDDDVYRWYPYFRPNGSPSSFAFDCSYCECSSADAGGGSRLCLKSEELSNYCGNQFLDLWKEHIL